MNLEQTAIPVRDAVVSVCEMLGYDPYYLACEGRCIAVVAADQADDLLARWQALPEGEGAAIIGEIEFEIHDVFDPDHPKERNWFFRAANTVHVKTRKGVIRRLLLFREGDAYSARALVESERVLREADYLFDVRIVPVAFKNNRVRVRVVTRDVWTLQAGLSFGRSGGANDYTIGLSDSNILGGIGARYSNTSAIHIEP